MDRLDPTRAAGCSLANHSQLLARAYRYKGAGAGIYSTKNKIGAD